MTIVVPHRSNWFASTLKEKRATVLFAFLLCFCSISLLTLITSVFFGRFNSDWRYYMSEAVCSDPSGNTICNDVAIWPSDLFERNVESYDRIPDLGARYTSETFARLYRIFLNPSDSLTAATAKIHIFRSLVASSIITSCLILTRRFRKSRVFAVRAAFCAFGFPYLLFTSSSVYPAPLASIAILLFLICVKAITGEENLGTIDRILLLFMFLVSSAVIMANRLEVTAFSGVAIFLVALQNWRTQRLRKHLVSHVLIFTALFSAFASQNSAIQNNAIEIIGGNFRVVSSEAAEASMLFRNIGDMGFSLLAPVTFVDNSTRNLILAIAGSRSSLGLMTYGLVALAWIPLAVVVLSHVGSLIQPIRLGRKLSTATNSWNWPLLLCFALFFVIPAAFRTIWFFQYAIPLILVSLFFANDSRLNPTLTKLLIVVSALSNLATFFAIARTVNIVYFWGLSIATPWLIIAGLMASLVAAGSMRYAMAM